MGIHVIIVYPLDCYTEAMQKNIEDYNLGLSNDAKVICETLKKIIDNNLSFTDSKIWHGHPAWFIEGNPIVGYSVQKKGIKLMFWSGASFEEAKLELGSGKFKDAGIFYNKADEIEEDDIKRWLTKAEEIQWDYKNIVKRKGELIRLK